ncbi:MAG TPA: hypothetical protein DCM36_05955 [Xanthomonadaceae bacterium]|nr:hypothetical protein [Xanthomonadaceae bacterium]
MLGMVMVAGATAWWVLRDTGHGMASGGPSATAFACPLPPGVRSGEAPLQTGVPSSLRRFDKSGYALTPLAGFSLQARVLSREDYRFGREADLSPTDLALGWGRMREDAVLAGLSLSQSGRWYRYRWQDTPPMPVEEIIRSSANMHMIPADETVAAALQRVRRDQTVRIDGWLVQADAPDGWHWRSSLTREDSGGGACELVYVCRIESSRQTTTP